MVVISLSLLVITGATAYQLRNLIGHAPPIRSGPGQAPYAIGLVWDCPPGWPVKAYRGGVYYPTYHPAAPSYDVRPDRCFQSIDEANHAGFRLASPPSGGTLLAGVYLMPTGKRLQDECLGAASLLRYSVPCPTVLPEPGGEDLCPLARCVTGSTFSMTVAYAVGGGNATAAATHYAHFFLTGAPVTSEVGTILSACDHPAGAPPVLGHQAAWGICFRGGDQIASLAWSSAGNLFEIQTREQTPTAKVVIEYFASRLAEVVAPGR